MFVDWHSDDYIQHAYGAGYSHEFTHLRFRNTQKHGQRYVQCGNLLRNYVEAIGATRYRGWQWALRQNHTDIAERMERSWKGFDRYLRRDFDVHNDTQLAALLDEENPNPGAWRHVLLTRSPEDRLVDTAQSECPIQSFDEASLSR